MRNPIIHTILLTREAFYSEEQLVSSNCCYSKSKKSWTFTEDETIYQQDNDREEYAQCGTKVKLIV